jgi:hypothetical protein
MATVSETGRPYIQHRGGKALPEQVAKLAEPEMQSKVERLFLIEIVSFDWNFPLYITPRLTLEEL